MSDIFELAVRLKKTLIYTFLLQALDMSHYLSAFQVSIWSLINFFHHTIDRFLGFGLQTGTDKGELFARPEKAVNTQCKSSSSLLWYHYIRIQT